MAAGAAHARQEPPRVTDAPVRTSAVGAIAWVSWRGWYNDLARSLGSRLAARALVLVAALLLVAWVVVGTWQLGSQLAMTREIVPLLNAPVAAVVFSLSALSTLLATLYSPERTTLDDMLAPLPVSESTRRAATYWSTAAIGVVLGAVWSAPLALEFLWWGGSPLASAAATALCFLVAISGALFSHLVLQLAQVGTVMLLGRPSAISRGLAGLVTALSVLSMLLAGLPAPGRESGGPLAPLGAALSWPLLGWTEGATAAMVLVVLPVALAAAGVGVSTRSPARTRWRPRRRPRPAPRRPARTLTGLEVRQWFRYPSNAVMLVVYLGAALAAVTLWRDAVSSAGGQGAAFLLLTLVGTIGVGSFGPTRAHHWIYARAGRPGAWVAPKLTAVLCIWGGLVLVIAGLLHVTGVVSLGEILPLLPLHVVELTLGCLVGLLLPVDSEHSISGALSEGVAVLCVVSATVVLGQVPWPSAPAYASAIAALLVALVAVYALVARRQTVTAAG
jgi:hypothetical protein